MLYFTLLGLVPLKFILIYMFPKLSLIQKDLVILLMFKLFPLLSIFVIIPHWSGCNRR